MQIKTDERGLKDKLLEKFIQVYVYSVQQYKRNCYHFHPQLIIPIY